jgi:hypothetical protein
MANIEEDICFRKMLTPRFWNIGVFYTQAFVFDPQCCRAEGHITLDLYPSENPDQTIKA